MAERERKKETILELISSDKGESGKIKNDLNSLEKAAIDLRKFGTMDAGILGLGFLSLNCFLKDYLRGKRFYTRVRAYFKSRKKGY